MGLPSMSTQRADRLSLRCAFACTMQLAGELAQPAVEVIVVAVAVWLAYRTSRTSLAYPGSRVACVWQAVTLLL